MYCQSEVCRSKVRSQYVPEVCSQLGAYRSEYVSPKYVDLEYVRSTFLKCVPSWGCIDRSSQSEVCRSEVRPKYVPSWGCIDRSMSVRSMSIWSTSEVRSELGVYRSEHVSPKYVDLDYVRSTFLKCVPSWGCMDRSMSVRSMSIWSTSEVRS